MLEKNKDIAAFAVSEQMHALIKTEAEKNERTLSGQIRYILNEWAFRVMTPSGNMNDTVKVIRNKKENA